MGKVLVQYYSDTGHPRQMVEIVAQGASRVEEIELRLKTLEDSVIEDIYWADGMTLVTCTHFPSTPWKVKKFWNEDALVAWGKITARSPARFYPRVA